MTDDQMDAPKGDETKKETAEVELTESDLDDVGGGLNPQPLPPIVRDKT